MSTIDQDSLETVACLLEKSEWQVFAEVCHSLGINRKRTDSLFEAWAQEDFLPEAVDRSLKLIIQGTIFKEENHDHGV